jgi:uncharacterized phage protein gp47/JayE
VWELLQELWDAWDPDAAEGTALDNLCRLLGLRRLPATRSTVTLTLTGTPATVIAAGKRARVPGGPIFALDEAATIAGGGTVDAVATATETGTLEAGAGTVDTIVDAVAGWASVTNAADAIDGTDQETDADLRLRREATISAGGSCTDQAARAALDRVDGVLAAYVISNRTDATVNGILPRARACVVYPNTVDPLLLARAVWDHLAGGLYSQGNQEYLVTDDMGHEQTVRFYWGTTVPIYWDITVTHVAGYPSNGNDLVKAAVLAYGNSLSMGDQVVPVDAIAAICHPVTGVPGVINLAIKVDTVTPPVNTLPVAIELDEVSTHDATRITVGP